ncbi:MAG TPA: S49 family peptidase [Polyangiaceae bacterium]|nr:S49 family peptidase [Polyangiaceae bacterium]
MSRRLFARSAAVLTWLAAALLGSSCDETPSSKAIGMLRTGLDKAAGGVIVDLDLTHGLSEHAPQMSLLSNGGGPTLAELVQVLSQATRDRRTHGFLVRLGESDLSWAQAEELGSTLGALPPEQPVVCHAHGLSNQTLFFALRACDRIWLSPAGEVASVGIASQMLYLRRLLDRLKIKADFLHMGRFKSATEPLTEDGPTAPARESLEAVLASIRKTWLDGIANARSDRQGSGDPINAGQISGDQIKTAAEHGPWSPDAAMKQGLIDAVGYVSDARKDAKERAHADDIETAFGGQNRRDAADEIAQLVRFIAGAAPSEHGKDHIVVLPLAGGINMNAGGALGGSDGIAAEPLSRTLHRLRDNDAVKAVVLRIDSPGGSALASDLIWHDLWQLREKKPLIASLAGTAASGGYYIACAATRILADQSTILGSIGVLGGKIVIGGTLDEIGVTGVTFPASKEPGAADRASYLSSLTPWDPATRESVRAQMSAVYELFLSRVSQGRSIPVDDVRAVAEGRIWSGVQGLERHLIDAYGGLADAILEARKQAGLPDDAEVKIESGPETLLQFLQLDPDADESSIRAAVARLRSAPPGLLDSAAQPLRPYVEALATLMGKEHVVTALPFALDVR